MYYFEIFMLIVGLVLLVVGYRKNSRNILLGAAFVWLAAGALPQFIEGMEEGYLGASQVRSAG